VKRKIAIILIGSCRENLTFFEFLSRCGAQDEFNHEFWVEILGFCLVGTHFHILGRVIPEYKFSDEDILKRLGMFVVMSASLLMNRDNFLATDCGIKQLSDQRSLYLPITSGSRIYSNPLSLLTM
jgi:hypothetical protein